MDPNENLNELRTLAQKIVREGSDYCEDGNRLAELVLALDTWLRAGGFLPTAWKGP